MLHVSCTLAAKNIQDPSMLWFVGSIWTCSSHPTKAEYGGPRYRCERGVKRPSRESLGATLVSVAKRLAEQHFVVFFALCQILWEFRGRNVFIYKQIFFLLIKCANQWDKRTFCFTSCWLAHIHLPNRTGEEPCVTNVTIILFEIT